MIEMMRVNTTGRNITVYLRNMHKVAARVRYYDDPEDGSTRAEWALSAYSSDGYIVDMFKGTEAEVRVAEQNFWSWNTDGYDRKFADCTSRSKWLHVNTDR